MTQLRLVSGYKFFSCCASCSTLIPSVSATCVCVCVCVCVWGGRDGGRGWKMQWWTDAGGQSSWLIFQCAQVKSRAQLPHPPTHYCVPTTCTYTHHILCSIHLHMYTPKYTHKLTHMHVYEHTPVQYHLDCPPGWTAGVVVCMQTWLLLSPDHCQRVRQLESSCLPMWYLEGGWNGREKGKGGMKKGREEDGQDKIEKGKGWQKLCNIWWGEGVNIRGRKGGIAHTWNIQKRG